MLFAISEELDSRRFNNRSKFTKGQTMQTYETLKHTTWECKSCGVHHEMPEEDPVWQNSRSWGQYSGNWRGKKNARDRGASDGRSCAHVAFDSTEVFGGAGIGVPEGKNGDPHCTGVYGRRRCFVGCSFWARGYWVSTVGRDEVARVAIFQEQKKKISGWIN